MAAGCASLDQDFAPHPRWAGAEQVRRQVHDAHPGDGIPRGRAVAGRRRSGVALTSHRTMLLAHWVTFFLQAVALFVLLLYGIMFLQHAVGAIRFPYQMDYGEGVEIDLVSRLLSGQPLYTDIHQPPYHVGVYPPLYTLTVAPIAALTGISYGPGRAVSAVLALFIAWLLGRMVYEECHRLWIGLVTGLFWLASHLVYSWAVLMRVDMLAMALSMLGLYFFWHGYIRLGKERYIYVAMVLFRRRCLCSTNVSLGCSFLSGLSCDDASLDVVGQGTVAICRAGTGAPGLLQIMTGGQFYQHLVTYNLPVWSRSRWQADLGRLWGCTPWRFWQASSHWFWLC